MSAKLILKRSGMDQQLGMMLRLARAAVWSDLTDRLDEVGLKPQSYAVLRILDANPGCKQQEIADALDIKRPNMVTLVDELAGQGLVARDANPNDKRSYALGLTDKGREILASANAVHKLHEERLVEVLGWRGSSALRAGLERLAEM